MTITPQDMFAWLESHRGNDYAWIGGKCIDVDETIDAIRDFIASHTQDVTDPDEPQCNIPKSVVDATMEEANVVFSQDC